MVGIVVRVVVNGAALYITTLILPELTFGPDPQIAGILGVAVVFGLVNAFVRPILGLLSFPLTLMTLGLFALVVNGLLLLIVAALSDALGLTFAISGFPPEFSSDAVLWAIVGSIVLSIVSSVLNQLPLPGDRG